MRSPHVGFSGGVVHLVTDSAANSGIGEDSSIFTPVLLLAPTWHRQPWYSSLVELSVAQAVRLPLDVFPLMQGNFTYPSFTMYNLHAWTFLGTGIEDRESVTTLPAFGLSRYGFHPLWPTIGSRTHSVLNVQSDSSILSLFL